MPIRDWKPALNHFAVEFAEAVSAVTKSYFHKTLDRLFTVPGQSNWPENPAFDRNLARLFAGNTCLPGKSTTQKAPQSANRSAL